MTRNIQLTDQQLKVIIDCLMLGPYGLVRPIVDCINAQLVADAEVASRPIVEGAATHNEKEGFTRTEY